MPEVTGIKAYWLPQMVNPRNNTTLICTFLQSIHPFSIPTSPALRFVGFAGVTGGVAARTNHEFITGPQRKTNKLFVLKIIPAGILEFLIRLLCMFLDCGRNPENLWRTLRVPTQTQGEDANSSPASCCTTMSPFLQLFGRGGEMLI